MYLTAEVRCTSGYSEPRKQRNFDSDGSPAAGSTGLGKVSKEDPIELKSGVFKFYHLITLGIHFGTVKL